MEKRVLLAAVLSGIVVIVWFSLFAPPRPSGVEPRPTPTAHVASGGVAAQAPEQGQPPQPAGGLREACWEIERILVKPSR